MSAIAKSSGGSGKKLSAYNKLMKAELARLKESDPDMAHKDRYMLISVLHKITLLIPIPAE